jgi:hypothetical protein
MSRVEGLYWHCLNRSCGRTLPAMEPEGELELRLCACGSPMRKQAQPAVFSYLDFLREEPHQGDGGRIRKEQGPCER